MRSKFSKDIKERAVSINLDFDSDSKVFIIIP